MFCKFVSKRAHYTLKPFWSLIFHVSESSFLSLINNFKFQVETVEGIKDLRIPCGIQPGDAVKLSRLGVPDVNKPSVRGDHHFIVNVLIPKDIRYLSGYTCLPLHASSIVTITVV